MTGPDDIVTRYIIGNDYEVNAGQVLEVRTEKAGVVVNRVVSSYVPNAQGQPFPDSFGSNIHQKQNFFANKLRPLRSTTIVRDGVTFVSTVNAFDAFARPLSVTKSSTVAGNPSKTEITAYHDNLPKWILGQPAKMTVNGIVASQTDYDATYALPIRFYSFTQLKQTLTYDTTASLASGQRGTIRTVVDGGNNTTTLGSWYRGIPRAITYADGRSQSAAVNASGWITRVTDENGFATNYAYDPMGRLSRITYPTSDTVAWNPTTISFAKSATGVYGIPAGHWRQIIANGDSRKVTYFDALWRPLVVREYDNANSASIAATERFIRYAYDHEGRVTFASYPSASYNPTAGTRTVYDALGRQTSVTQSSELGLLKTTTEYLAGFQARVTDPRGNQTHYRYLAWDQPTTDFITRIIQPEGAYTYFGRDAFGKPLYITRRTADGSVSLARRYVYGGAERLCIVTEPETGSTVYGFNGADLLVQTAAGLTLPSGISCRDAKTQAWSSGRRVDRSYDKRNRLTSVTYPDNLGNTSYSYTPDGLLAQVLIDNVGSGLVYNNYIYNKRRLLTGESMDWNNISYGIGYGYNANGHLASHAYPGAVTVAYAPNALGQPTRAGGWATDVSYHPNGSIKQFTYGNSIVHKTTQNARGLPARIVDFYGASSVYMDDRYVYDGNGNVEAIGDARSGNRGDRVMAYDGLNRLTRVDSNMFGTARYAYDVLDNLRRVQVGATAMRAARDHTYEYDARNRLSRIVNTTGGATVTSLGYDLQGNITSRTGASYDFDFGNRLRSASQDGTSSSYVYDGHGRRVRDYIGGSKYTQYSRDGTLMFARNLRGTNANEQYIHLGGRLIAIRSHNRDTDSVVTQYQHTDALGSVVARSSHSRGSVIYSEYEPYGALSNRPNHDRPAYTGHVQDAATGLTYMQQRYYDPVIGRFLSMDPVTAYETSDYRYFNRYAYAFNNPYKFTDSDGRCPTCTFNPKSIAAMASQARVSQAQKSGIEQARAKSAFIQVEGVARGGSPIVNGNVQTGVGVLISPKGVDVYQTKSATVGAMGDSVSLIDGSGTPGFVLGAVVGGSLTGGITNADGIQAFSGATTEGDLSAGPVTVSATSNGTGIWSLSGGLGAGPAASVSQQQIETTSVDLSRDRR
ncbi:RHS repeat domain-containing protein [Luteimonas sp. C3_2_a3]|uniref:RHS repeat domain-containing protein n=1 Tax=Luteimonas salinilitoris TaxID=3237697 RepID=UPI00351C635A